jgi:hypothetical protein
MLMACPGGFRIMIRKLALPALATLLLAGCITDYTYRGAGGAGDYYYGRPSVDYRYYGGYGGGYGGYYGGYYGGWGGYYPYTHPYAYPYRYGYGYPHRYGYGAYGYPGGRYPYYGYPGYYGRGHGQGHGNYPNRPGRPNWSGPNWNGQGPMPQPGVQPGPRPGGQPGVRPGTGRPPNATNEPRPMPRNAPSRPSGGRERPPRQEP